MKKRIVTYSPYAFILLWGYAATVKLWNWNTSRREMHLQPFPDWMGDILFWLVPSAFVWLSLLFIDSTRHTFLRTWAPLLVFLYPSVALYRMKFAVFTR